MKVHELAPSPGAHRGRRRVARGISGKGGKTAGRGTKGQLARSKVKVGFEGGQLPLTQRIPKLRGFKNPFRVEYNVVNLEMIEALSESKITLEILRGAGLVHHKGMVKVLGGGAITRAVTIEAHAFSASAKAAIERSGGSVTVLPSIYGDNRPPVRGNALANR